MKTRYERKFLIESLTRSEVEMIVKLNPAKFREIYHPRYVNNIYFDTDRFRSYQENIEGNFSKKKIRIRWYGELMGQVDNPQLEKKMKEGELGTKDSYKLRSFSLARGRTMADLLSLVESSPLGSEVRRDGLRPTLINRYKRKYFQSIDKKYRVTIDSELSYYSTLSKQITFLQRQVDDKTIILELKYSSTLGDQVNRITNRFPFRMTKSSKYVLGVEKIVIKR